MGTHQWGSLGLAALAFAPLHQAVAVEHGVDGAHRRCRDHRVLADQLVAQLRCAPGGVLLLDPQDRAFDLVGQLVGLAVRRPAAVIEPVQATCLVAVEDLVACHPGDAEFTTERRHLLAFEQAGNELQSLIHRFTLFPGHLGSPQMPKCVNHVPGIFCKLSVDKLKV